MLFTLTERQHLSQVTTDLSNLAKNQHVYNTLLLTPLGAVRLQTLPLLHVIPPAHHVYSSLTWLVTIPSSSKASAASFELS
jgi:hypothetical protein